jgi:hypothetical protein
MPARVFALFLIFVLLWSGLSTIEAPRGWTPPSPEHRQPLTHAGGQAATDEGSVEHHHLDDLPSQVQYEPSAETPGLLPAPLKPGARALAMSRPPAVVSAGARPPFLAGPLRPPCCSVLAG